MTEEEIKDLENTVELLKKLLDFHNENAKNLSILKL